MLAGRIEKHPKTYEDARSEVLELLQKQLEASWLQQLRRTYTVTINQDVLNFHTWTILQLVYSMYTIIDRIRFHNATSSRLL